MPTVDFDPPLTGPLTRTHQSGSGLRPRDRLLAFAEDYAGGAHWPLFVLGRTKRPVANCLACRRALRRGDIHDRQACACLTCHGFYAATTDFDRITAMVDAIPGGLLALRTGAVSRRVIVDIDPRHGGVLDRALMPPTTTVATGGGGWHLYYRHPGGTIPSRPLPGHPGVDIKADGGYVVLPPSIHPITRREYEWAHTLNVDTEEMPRALVEACRAPSASPAPAPLNLPPTRRGGGISHPDLLLAAHLHAVARAPKGRRRVTLYGAARGVARMVLAQAISTDDAITALTSAGRHAEQTEREIRAAIAGGFHDEGVAI